MRKSPTHTATRVPLYDEKADVIAASPSALGHSVSATPYLYAFSAANICEETALVMVADAAAFAGEPTKWMNLGNRGSPLATFIAVFNSVDVYPAAEATKR